MSRGIRSSVPSAGACGFLCVLMLALTAPATYAADGDFVWAKGMGGTSGELGDSIAVDDSGNVYTTGYFLNPVDFDPGPGIATLTTVGSYDIFVSKLDANGDFVWAKAMGGLSFDAAYGIAVDGVGSVYTVGFFSGTADFDPGPGTSNLTSAGLDDIFISKLDANGNFVWAKAMGQASNTDQAYSVTLDSLGNVYTTGFFTGTVDFDPGAGTANLTAVGDGDIFVSKLDTSGNHVWAKAMGGSSFDLGWEILVDDSQNVYVTGEFQGTADFDPGAGTANLTSAGGRDIFLSKLDSSGNFVWAKRMGGTSGDQGRSIALDGSGNVYTTGQFTGTVDFDPGAGTANLTSAGSADIFVSKLDANGDYVWSKAMGGSSADLGHSIALYNSEYVYTTGVFQGTVDFDPGAGTSNLTSSGNQDVFVSKLDVNGNYVWAKRTGGSSPDYVSGITTDGSGNLHITGGFQSTVDFDPGVGTSNLTSAGGYDIFVWKLSGADAIPPNVTNIAPGAVGPTNADSILFNVTFDEDVQNFDAVTDLVIAHSGTASTGVTVGGGPSTYTVTVTGITGDGSFTLAVNTASDVQDLAANPLATSVTSAPVAIDNTPPEVSISAPSVPITASGPVSYIISYTGADTITLGTGDVSLVVTGDAGATVGVGGSGLTQRTVTLSDITGDGTLGISIATTGTATDVAGNLATLTGPSATVTVDNTAPVFSGLVATPAGAGAGTTVSLTFDANEALLLDPEVTVNGNFADGASKASYVYDYTVQPSDPLGPAVIDISGFDLAGNVGALNDTDALTIVPAESALPVAAWPIGLALALAGIAGLRLRRGGRG